MKKQSTTLNIRHDLSNNIWENSIPKIYEFMEGWLCFSKEEVNKGSAYWFSFDETQKHIWASVELSGLLFCGLMEDEEWENWMLEFQKVATKQLGFKVEDAEN